MNNVIVSAICLLALVISIFLVDDDELIPKRQKKHFNILAILICVIIILDTVAHVLNGNVNVSIHVLRCIKAVEFILTPLVPTILAYIICRRSFWKNKIKNYFVAAFLINCVCQVLNLFAPIMFYFDEVTHLYTRNWFGYFYLIILLADVILLAISSVKTFIQNVHKFNSMIMIMIDIFLVLGAFIRIFDINSNLDWLAVTFAYFLFLEALFAK